MFKRKREARERQELRQASLATWEYFQSLPCPVEELELEEARERERAAATAAASGPAAVVDDFLTPDFVAPSLRPMSGMMMPLAPSRRRGQRDRHLLRVRRLPRLDRAQHAGPGVAAVPRRTPHSAHAPGHGLVQPQQRHHDARPRQPRRLDPLPRPMTTHIPDAATPSPTGTMCGRSCRCSPLPDATASSSRLLSAPGRCWSSSRAHRPWSIPTSRRRSPRPPREPEREWAGPRSLRGPAHSRSKCRGSDVRVQDARRGPSSPAAHRTRWYVPARASDRWPRRSRRQLRA